MFECLQVLVSGTCVILKQKVAARFYLDALHLHAFPIVDITHNIHFCSSIGIWVWGTPIELDIDGVKTSVFYLDTEGFESIGKSNVYDDR